MLYVYLISIMLRIWVINIVLVIILLLMTRILRHLNIQIYFIEAESLI